MKNNNPA